MNWKAEARDKLRRHMAVKAALVNIPEEIDLLETEAYCIKSATADGTPVKGGGSGREDRLLDNITRRGELEQMLIRAQKTVAIVERGLATLNQDERHILEEMYIKTGKGYVDRLMAEYKLAEESSLYKKANKALHHFTIAMYGGTES